MSSPLIYRDRRAILLWLIACALLVAGMVLIGGYTRLSGSGLSITQWKPIHGSIPPYTLAQWQEEFAGYQASPQYQQVNKGMSLEEFKVIFWPEFIHRLLGRAIGVVFFLPLVVFALRRSVSARFGWRMVGILALGGLQGVIGWLMVKSGLVDAPYVSPVRLALHLSTALLIYGFILWTILEVLTSASPCRGEGRGGRNPHIPSVREGYALPSPPPCRERGFYSVWFVALCLQIILGAFMAGLHAGLIYNTWPDMNGQFLPEGLGNTPFLSNITLVQFLHRNVAILVALGFVFWWYLCRAYVKNGHLGKSCAWVAAIIAGQFMLGVLTLLHQAPLDLALAHQMGALLLLTAAIILLYKVKR